MSGDDGRKGLSWGGLAAGPIPKLILLGVVFLSLFLIMEGDFLPLIERLLDAMLGGGYAGSAIGSSKAMTYAISCTSIMNAHKPGDDVYRDEWDTPFEDQGFGSDISKSCAGSVDSPVKFEDTSVSCDSYDTENGKCSIERFNLPQDVSYTGPGSASPTEAVKNWIIGQGQPKYVLYYQSLDPKVEKSWLKRTEGYNMMAIALGGVMGVIPVASGSMIKTVGGETLGFFPSFGLRRYGAAFAGKADNVVRTGARWGGRALYKYSAKPVVSRVGAKAAGAKMIANGAIERLAVKVGAQRLTSSEASAVLDDFVSGLSQDASKSGGIRAAFEGGQAEPGRIVIRQGDNTLSRADFRSLVRNNFEDALNNNGVRSEFTEAEIEELSETLSEKLINSKTVGEEVADRVAAESPEYAQALSGAGAWEYGIRTTMTADNVAGSIIQSSDRLAAARKLIDKATRSGRAMGGTTKNVVSRGSVAAACNSKLIRSEVVESIANEFDGEELSFWMNTGRCAAFSGAADSAVKGVCSRAGVTAVRDPSGMGVGGTAACAAVTAAAHGVEWASSNAYKSVPGNVNSLYLKRAFSPPVQFKLHPISNYYFAQLTRSDGNPDARFFLASPVSMENVKDADDPRIVVRPGTSEVKTQSVFSAKDNIEGREGPDGLTPCDNLRDAYNDVNWLIQNIIPDIPILGGIEDAVFGDITGDINPGITRETASEYGLAGSFFKEAGVLCDSEVMYTKLPQLHKKPSEDSGDAPSGFSADEWSTSYISNPKAGGDREVPEDYFKQLWRWNNECEDDFNAIPGYRGGCKYTWKYDKYPEIYSEGVGTTYYNDPATLNKLWNNIIDTGNLGSTANVEDMRSIQISFEGMPADNWRTEDGNAIYGYNSDIQKNQYAEAAMVVGVIVVEGVAAVATGGTSLVTAVAAGAGGTGGEAAIQWISKQNAWPNH